MKQRQVHPELTAALASLAAEDAPAAPPADLEARLLAEFSEARRPAVRRSLPAWVAVAATTAIAAAVLQRGGNTPKKVAETPFVQVPFVAPPAPYERVEVVRENVPIAALLAAGFEVHVSDTSGAVPADVLVAQDGRALAIRLASGAISQAERGLE